MPNHVANTLEISGDKEELKRFIEFAKTGDKDLDHEKFIPYPQTFKDMDKDDPNKSFNLDKVKDKDLLVDGMDGHEWANANFGTKWGIYDSFMNTTIEQIDDNEDQTLCYSFNTAWSPCFPVIEKMSEMFPKLSFELEYEESGSDFEGTFQCEKGEIIIDDQRDYVNVCDECGVKAEDVTYDEDDENTLCEKCRMTPLQKIVHDKIEQENNK